MSRKLREQASLNRSCCRNFLYLSDRRSKSMTESALRNIKGVGEKTEQRLLLSFGSVARIAAAPVEDVAAIVGQELALRIKESLR